EIRARARKIQNASAYLDMHNTAITKDCFTNLGGLNKNLPLMAEFELGARLHQQSVHIERVEHIKVLHFNDTRLISYSNGIAAHGRDRTRMLIQHGRRFMKSYFPNPRLIRYRKTLTSLRLPVLICLKILLSCSVAGFGLGRLLNMYPVSLYFFRHVARNSLRYGEVSALK
ncbi:hypothetical protein KY363_05425, partial [Candidatus Woesearchaeota archaeon]|nr:hypothetical protein [Candidatus Woesearchaeota archaeon]